VKRKQHTRLIVIIGFIIMASLCILGIALIYGELLNFSKSSDTSAERKELVTTSNILASLHKVESIGNLLIAGKTDIDFSLEYDSLKRDTYSQIESFKSITKDTVLVVHMDSILYLMDRKATNIRRILLLLDSINSEPPKEVVKKSIISKRDYSDLEDILYQSINRVKSVEDTTFVKNEKKKLFDRVRNVFANKADSSIVVSKKREERQDSVLVPVLIDTLTQYVQELSWKYEERHRYLTQQLIQKQNLMHRMNEELSLQINVILRAVERREYETSMNLMREKEITLERSSQIVSIIGILASLTALVFLIMTMTSITHSQRYRKQLEVSKKYAEDLLDARERLILSITHDIKTPISSIIGYMELLSRNKLSEKERYYIENMQHSSEHILELVRNLLDYHSLESDKQEILNMAFYPAILLNDIYQSFIPLAQKSAIDFRFECHLQDEQSYESDPYRIRQICENLLSNAVKFTDPKGKVEFNVSFIREDENVDLLNISVKDTGAGISKENQELIFEEFRRLDFHKGTTEGSGLGLTITKKLISRLNGTISLISEEGKGSEFTVKIPLRKTEKKQLDNTVTFSHVKKIQDSGEKRILFIDDDVIQLNLYSELLKREGFQTTICKKSLEALDLIQTSRFDLIFSDIQMPDMNGFELVERIRMGTFDGAQTVPVIALSGNSKVSEQKFIEAGFSGFISKPFTSESILSMIYQFLGEQDKQCPSEMEKKEKRFDALMAFAPDDTKAGKAIVQSFIDEFGKYIQIISDALSQNDWNSIKGTAHKMLPLMRMISADDLVNVLVEIEAGTQDEDKVNQIIQLTKNQLNAAGKFLKTI